MIKTITNIIKGRVEKLLLPKSKGRFARLTWLQEKTLKHQEDRQIKKIKLNDFTVFYKRPYELLHTYKDLFQHEIYRYTSAKKNQVIIDCGANIGLSVIYYKQLFPAATIFAFEPDANNFALLQQNIRANKFNDVHLHQSAIWTKDGEISFDALQSEASHISTTGTGTAEKVKSIRLNTFLSQFKEIDFLKVDIEGAEWEVLKDCSTNLWQVQNLFLEYHGKVSNTNKLTDLLNLVAHNGFQVYIKTAADHLKYPFAEKKTTDIYDVQLNIFCYR